METRLTLNLMDTQINRPVILISCDYYLPGYESGGALRTLVNMVDRLSDAFDFRIVTRDHDGKSDRTPYTTVQINDWNRVGNAQVYYLSTDNIRAGRIKQLIDETSPNLLYLNSLFSTLSFFILMLRRLNRIDLIPLVLAPEGEFSAGALTLKPLKKQLYIRSAKLLRSFDNIVWKAAAESERDDILSVIGKACEIIVAPNMPPKMVFDKYSPSLKPEKLKGQARMVFLSRYMRKKNFNWLLEHLHLLSGDLLIDIFGPLEEEDYWEDAKRIIETLPDNITIEAKGPVPHDMVPTTLAKYHFFILPTLGENFGHVFVEALASGCPIITSDQTPWRNLEDKGIGWDLSLEKPDDWNEILNRCLYMTNDDYQTMSQKARAFAVDWLSDPAVEESNRHVLLSALKF